ncbi:uncharacterized protein LOC112497171 isoform X3 [Citrus sinensis]|uniref:uncharacterized protein LOC112497171 isoform X2 n=1 Tax=Citrus sinensis TaxID=2711 RepID=UPI000D6278EA|nr:uncharacterized protein LOC112497171 isoform X2 [Citrus sinensis]XP_024950484.1 uncharacterized protein LOC112497171 isoform X3 [Citrus sinensis]
MCFFMYMERKKKEKKKGMRGTSKDLLHLEHKDSSASAIARKTRTLFLELGISLSKLFPELGISLSSLCQGIFSESALLACSKKDTNVELKKQNPGKMPNYGPVPRSQGRHPA